MLQLWTVLGGSSPQSHPFRDSHRPEHCVGQRDARGSNTSEPGEPLIFYWQNFWLQYSSNTFFSFAMKPHKWYTQYIFFSPMSLLFFTYTACKSSQVVNAKENRSKARQCHSYGKSTWLAETRRPAETVRPKKARRCLVVSKQPAHFQQHIPHSKLPAQQGGAHTLHDDEGHISKGSIMATWPPLPSEWEHATTNWPTPWVLQR